MSPVADKESSYEQRVLTVAISTSFMTSSSAVDDDDGIPYIHRVIVASCLCLVLTLGLLGNTLVMASIPLSKKLQTITNILVVNLAVADFLTCASLPFMVIGLTETSGEYPLPEIVCSAVAGLSLICIAVSVSTLATIAIERWYVITKLVRGHRGIHSPGKLIIVVLVIWTASTIVVVLPVMFGVGELGYSSYYSLCSVTDNNAMSSLYVILQSAVVLIALIITGFFYTLVMVFVIRQNRILRQTFTNDVSLRHTVEPVPTSRTSHSSKPSRKYTANSRSSDPSVSLGNSTIGAALNRREVEIAKNLFLVVCVFVICFLPSAVNFLIPGSSVFTLYGSVIAVTNSALNPVIYSLKHPNFQEVFRSVLRCRLSDISEPGKVLRSWNSANR
ncbi:beta-3 adrenergic receptor-like [Diadema antillarum]|uniref:beta-3 adrenergic receptor-like n=1 Tax=Diadema antillarum TaxID=105358 RepID=UPI003A882B73